MLYVFRRFELALKTPIFYFLSSVEIEASSGCNLFSYTLGGATPANVYYSLSLATLLVFLCVLCDVLVVWMCSFRQRTGGNRPGGMAVLPSADASQHVHINVTSEPRVIYGGRAVHRLFVSPLHLALIHLLPQLNVTALTSPSSRGTHHVAYSFY